MNQNDLLPGQEEYWGGYQASIDKQKSDPRLVEFDKLCYEIFHNTEAGKELLSTLVENYLMRQLGGNTSGDFKTVCVYWEGYRDCIRMLRCAAVNYKLRREAEDAKAIKKASEEIK